MNRGQFNLSIEEIRQDRARGASALARRALALVARAARTWPARDAAELREQLAEFADALGAARPSMTPVGHLLRRWRKSCQRSFECELDAARRAASEHAEALIAASRQAVGQCARHAARLLGPDRTLLTHSLSATVAQTCRLLKGASLRVIVTEARPLAEGRQLAQRLAGWGVPTTCITDAQGGLFVAQADAVLVGADSVLADGAVVNKAGTYLLALAARDRGLPFYVCAESFKWRAAEEPAPELEEMAADELGAPAWPGVTVRNVYFDLTPARLVSAWIDETGVRRPDAGA